MNTDDGVLDTGLHLTRREYYRLVVQERLRQWTKKPEVKVTGKKSEDRILDSRGFL